MVFLHNKKRYLLIKGPHLFIFSKKDSSAPKYAVELLHRNVCYHEVVGHTQVVTFETGLGEVDYKFIFDLRENKLIAKNFAAALREEVAIGNNKEIKEVRFYSGLLALKSFFRAWVRFFITIISL